MIIHSALTLTKEQEQLVLAEAKKMVQEEKIYNPHTVEVLEEEGQMALRVIGTSPIVRVRRITGYLSTTDRFNDAKLAELHARTTHGCCQNDLDPLDRLKEKSMPDCAWTEKDQKKVLADFV
ncbi:hypothetical protein FTV88_1455 [Heliorestis convoluta]|uniref:Uncharacterized protein n=1 Tax=Heliorestis convoluta TaxID=356322 RepID=A0A5Q2N2U6_9FIRM|nr:hypothetical protein [Heliorestis convoluta]QGG47602.1 hypothetical protein FTV88_1455 [Heliorestis convoluta]